MELRKWISWLGLPMASILLTGCAEVSQKDVSEARETVRQEQRETNAAREQARENVLEEREETRQTRREALKPVIDDAAVEAIRQEKKETREAREAGREAVRQERKETLKAKEAADKTEAQFNARLLRDEYVKQVESKLEVADKQMVQLEEQGEKLEGTAKDANEKQLDQINTKREKVDDALGELKAVKILDWKESRPAVEQALENLIAEIDKAK